MACDIHKNGISRADCADCIAREIINQSDLSIERSIKQQGLQIQRRDIWRSVLLQIKERYQN